jgi:ribonucleoside-diphosphate reductase alpha chain
MISQASAVAVNQNVAGLAEEPTAFKRDYEEQAKVAEAEVAAEARLEDRVNALFTGKANADAAGAKADASARKAVDADRRTKSLMQGYTGNSCSECQNFTMVRNGTCEKCDTCGATSGCS